MAERAAPFSHPRADDSAGFLLWKLTALWRARLEAVFEAHGITQTQYAILASLRWFEAQREPTTQAHLAAHARLDKMTLSKSVRQLESLGLVARTPSRDDARATDVRLTARGRRLAERAIVEVESADEAFFGTLAPAELARFKRLVATLVERGAAGTMAP